jgi:flagellar protein FlaG
MVSGINELVHELQRELHFAVDGQSGETVIKVVDRETEEVVRQIPSEEVLRLRQRLEEAAGVLFDGSA